jgi:SAM-dependent methyltransferase
MSLLFEERYNQVRNEEGRIYTDETLRRLPEVPVNHRYYGEWAVRKRSSLRLIRYLAAKTKPQHILEIGCGNGWLCHRLSLISGARVTGQDINLTELQQAARVFGGASNIRFTSADLYSKGFSELGADVIVFAASIQYFPSLEKTLKWSLQQLVPGGEIHILDSPFYEAGEVREAKKRTLDYFSAMGFPEMAQYYFHNTRAALEAFNPKLLYNPRSIGSRILRRKNPFPWYRIKNEASPVA